MSRFKCSLRKKRRTELLSRLWRVAVRQASLYESGPGHPW